MNTHRPTSSNVDSYAYDPASRELTVTYSGGRKYRYPDVSKDDFDQLHNSHSKGGHVWAALRNRKTQRVV